MGSIDADAHVIECERTFDFLEPEFEKYRPLVVGADYGHADTATEIEAMRKLGDDGKLPEAVAAKILDQLRGEGYFDAMRNSYGQG